MGSAPKLATSGGSGCCAMVWAILVCRLQKLQFRLGALILFESFHTRGHAFLEIIRCRGFITFDEPFRSGIKIGFAMLLPGGLGIGVGSDPEKIGFGRLTGQKMPDL